MENVNSMVLVGKRKFLKKDKSGYCYMVGFLREFVAEEKEEGALGYATKESFVTEAVYNQIGASDINREFVFEYGINRFGNPDICGIRFAEGK